VDFQATFQSLTYLSSILAFLAFSNMSNHSTGTQRQNASNANYESVIQRGDWHGSSSRRLLPLPLSSRAGDDLSWHRGSVPFARGSSSRPLPVHPGHRQSCSLPTRCSTTPSPTSTSGPHLCFGHHGRRTLGSPEGVGVPAQVRPCAPLWEEGILTGRGSDLGTIRRRGRFGMLPP